MSTTWQERHALAVVRPNRNEQVILDLLNAVTDYILQAEANEGDARGEWRDFVLGAYVGQILDGIRGLLNGDLGRLDAGTLDATLAVLAERIGWDADRSRMSES